LPVSRNIYPTSAGVFSENIYPQGFGVYDANIYPTKTSTMASVSVYKTAFPRYDVNVYEVKLSLGVKSVNIYPYAYSTTALKSVNIYPWPIQNPMMRSVNVYPYQIGRLSDVLHNDTYEIYLDEKNIKGYVEYFEIEYSQEAAHNTISISGINPDLYYYISKTGKSSDARIKVVTNTITEWFLLIDCDGTPFAFDIFGISVSGQYGSGFSYVDAEYDPSMVSDMAGQFISGITWDAVDWMLSDAYSHTGDAVSAVKRLADSIGAVMECDQDGAITVRPAYPIRPFEMQTANYVAIFDRGSIFSISSKIDHGDKYNSVEVLGPTSNVDVDFNIEVESDPSPVIGGDAIVRAYYPQPNEPESITLSVTAGKIERRGVTELTIEDEQVVFDSGYGTAQKPVVSISDVKWLGNDGGNVTFFPYRNYLRNSNEITGIAKITYKTKYHSYRCFGANVSQLIGEMLIPIQGGDDLMVSIGDGSNVNPDSISDDLLTAEIAKLARGKAEIDSNYYDRETVSMEAVYNEDVFPGRLILIDDVDDDIQGVFHIMRVKKKYDGPAIFIDIEAQKCIIET